MALRVYNSLNKTKEIFNPISPGKVNIYVCGVTVYDRCHMGHARCAVVFDVIIKYLRHKGYDVTYVRNFTDIDDKIINRANEEGEDWQIIAERHIKGFYRDMDGLGVERATIEPKATDHIPDMIDIIQKLIDRGHAYQSDGDVFFAVDTFPAYGNLSGKKLEELEAGARVQIDTRKKNPLDFVLWKESKPGEPAWESAWGRGRPGWHIECSAMSSKYLGDTFDIHGGGQDLIFPHHENEIAQSEAATGKMLARYWIHNGFVYINKEKMSKSLGNIFAIQEALRIYYPEVVRLFLISHHYRGPLDFSDVTINETEAALERFYKTLKAIDDSLVGLKEELPLDNMELKGDEREIYKKLKDLPVKFECAMDDDFNTALAVGHMFDAVRALNRFMDLYPQKEDPTFLSILSYGGKQFRKLGDILGILISEPAQYLEDQKARKLRLLNIDVNEIEAEIEERNLARREKDWARADKIRTELAKRGILLEDGPEKTTWRVA